MDTQWFKAAIKRAGVTSHDLGAAIDRDRSVISRIANGAQKMTLDQARAMAPVLQVDLTELLDRAGLAEPALARALQQGFSEGDAAPFAGGTAEDLRHAALAEAFGQRAGVDVWRVRGRGMELAGYLPGDFILVDTFAADNPRPGDAVIAQVYGRTSARTVFRRFAPPVLVACSADPDEAGVHVVDGDNVVIRGKVTASWRLTG
ncbi:MAG TPA: hypothetical protein PKD10_05305 [Paracoccaceae bacterium]|nr:hypothetical protein [Paracoccaceae bacterium]